MICIFSLQRIGFVIPRFPVDAKKDIFAVFKLDLKDAISTSGSRFASNAAAKIRNIQASINKRKGN